MSGNIPTNLRYLLKSLSGNNTSVTNANSGFSEAEMNALRQAYLNSQKRFAEWEKDVALHGEPYDEAGEAYFTMKANPYITYSDYNMGGLNQSYDDKNIKTIIKNSQNSPAYRMGSTIGQAHYKKDKNGNIILRDTYDFPKDLKVTSKGLQLLHSLGANLGTPYSINLNLGNPSTWNLR